jgi:riboflavin kinase / FMN adenylyltransferase
MAMTEVNPTHAAKPGQTFTVVRGLRQEPGALRGAIVAIGNFDGLHLGHRAVISRAQAMAAQRGCPAAVLTFEPHPRAFFRPQEPLFRLTPEPIKLALLARLGLDGAFVLDFDAALAATRAAAFLEDLLVRRLGVSGLVVGHDFHFGRDREGTPAFLAREGARLGLAVAVVEALMEADRPVSSSGARKALQVGDVESAARLLGHRYIVRAEVIHGDKRGRTLGYPTANMRLEQGNRLAHGIYAVRVALDGMIHDGVASYGRRPTFDNGPPMLEVFIFDFAGDLYGRIIDVEFCAFIRGEETFAGADALIARMNQDSAQARRALARGKDVPAPSLLPLGPGG